MNYYNPYMGAYPYMAAQTSSTGLMGKIFGRGGINFSSILSGTQKFLGVANQAIPVIRQVAPVMKNAKTMFKVMNEFKKVDTPDLPKKEVKTQVTADTFSNSSTDYSEGPTFFI